MGKSSDRYGKTRTRHFVYRKQRTHSYSAIVRSSTRRKIMYSKWQNLKSVSIVIQRWDLLARNRCKHIRDRLWKTRATLIRMNNLNKTFVHIVIAGPAFLSRPRMAKLFEFLMTCIYRDIRCGFILFITLPILKIQGFYPQLRLRTTRG